MRIEGRALGPLTGTVLLPSRDGGPPLSIRVRAHSASSLDAAADLFPAPSPPTEYVMRNGAIVWRGDTPATKENDQDPKFRAELRRVNRLQLAYWIHESIVDPAWHWDTDSRLREKDPVAFYSAIYAELEAAGFSPVEVMSIWRKIQELSQVTPDAIRDATQAFSSGEDTPEKGGPSPRKPDGANDTPNSTRVNVATLEQSTEGDFGN